MAPRRNANDFDQPQGRLAMSKKRIYSASHELAPYGQIALRYVGANHLDSALQKLFRK